MKFYVLRLVKSIRFNKQLSMSKIQTDRTVPLQIPQNVVIMDQMYNGFYTRFLLRLCICCTLTFFYRNYTNHNNIFFLNVISSDRYESTYRKMISVKTLHIKSNVS
jgi:hypothetical protein